MTTLDRKQTLTTFVVLKNILVYNMWVPNDSVLVLMTVAFIRWQVPAWKCWTAECQFWIQVDWMGRSKLQRQRRTVPRIISFQRRTFTLWRGWLQVDSRQKLKDDTRQTLCLHTVAAFSNRRKPSGFSHTRKKVHPVESCSNRRFWHQESAEEKQYTSVLMVYC